MKKMLVRISIFLLLLIIAWNIFQQRQSSPVNSLIPENGRSDSIGEIDSQVDRPDTSRADSLSPQKQTFFSKLSDAAIERTMHSVVYDPKYVQIPYPMGDVPSNIGVCTDVVIRSYRTLGIDLQQRLHEDIRKNFNQYPAKKVWGSKKPDTNIDHRRVYNLQAFFKRFGETLAITDDPKDYQPGDIVTWQITPKFPHIGIMVDVATANPNRYMVVHNIADGPKIDDILFAFPITGHYRYR